MTRPDRAFRFGRRILPAFLLLAIAPLSSLPAAAATPVPSVNGYTISNRQDLSAGVTYVQYRSTSPRRVVNVAFLRRSAPEHLRMVVSNEMISGPGTRTETVSSMCKRVGCKIAVNGDFFSRANGQPAGGVAVEGEPARTPPGVRHHFFEDWAGNVGVRRIEMPIRLYATYPNGQKPFYVHSVNTARDRERMVVYTTRWGTTTETAAGGFELNVKVLNPPVRMDKEMQVQIRGGAWRGASPIPRDGMIVSGLGGTATALAQLWTDVVRGSVPATAKMTFDSIPDLRTYTGGTPALLIAGKQAFTNDGSSFMNTSDPKTMVGRTWSGDAVLAVVDGRQPSWSTGMTMTQAMQFMRSLGCVEALNLDGGGSSQFIKNGVVINKPSDGRERPIATALTIVP